jgi:predicted MPP superfamily phosphohydrolase
MVPRILLISDLHLGRHEMSDPYAALHELRQRLNPELLVVTGDLGTGGGGRIAAGQADGRAAAEVSGPPSWAHRIYR